MDAVNRPFSQDLHTRNISDRGAMLSGLEKQLRTGDVIGIQFGKVKARCKIIWTSEAGPGQEVRTGVRIVKGQPCPWEKQMLMQRITGTSPIHRTAPTKPNERRFRRLRIRLPIEIRDEQSFHRQMNATSSDITGKGCYVETIVPFPLGREVAIAFWLNSERVSTTAIVRTCDGGVGMGIEFIGLDEGTQERLQAQLEAQGNSTKLKMAQGAS